MVITINGTNVAVVEADRREKLITGTQTALDLAMTVKYEHNVNRIAISKEAIANEFFVLSSGMAGEILQKYVDYQVKIAIYGDFSCYTSKPLHDFIYESNHGGDVFFVPTKEEAIDRLARA